MRHIPQRKSGDCNLQIGEKKAIFGQKQFILLGILYDKQEVVNTLFLSR